VIADAYLATERTMSSEMEPRFSVEAPEFA
jgi:hypothetical protein